MPAPALRRAAALAVVAALAAGAVGCGSGGASDTVTGPGRPEPASAPTLTTNRPAAGKAAFVARADAVCTGYRHEIARINRALTRELRGAKNRFRLAALLDRSAAAADRTVHRIGRLDVPAGDEPTIAAYLDSGREAASALRSAADAFRADDGRRANERMAEVRLAGSRGRTIAGAYGFLVCGTPNPQAG